MTTREVRATLGGISQPRVSQLVRDGELIAEPDAEGRLRYDRESVIRLARVRAIRAAQSEEGATDKEARNREARDRLKRERERDEREAKARQEYEDDLRERTVKALEGIRECLARR